MSGQGKPKFSGKAPAYSMLWLIQTSKIVKPVPIYVWVTVVKDGWSGWLETQRRPGAAVLPSFWAKSRWKECSEKDAEKAKAAARAAATESAKLPKTLTGKEMREAEIASGKAERAAKRLESKGKPGPVKAEPVATPDPEPEPEPTGTDPGTGSEPAEPANDAATVAAALETAVLTLASVAQSLRKGEAERQGKARTVAAKPGLRKAGGKPAVATKRKAARR